MNRRNYLKNIALASGGMVLTHSAMGTLASLDKKKTVLLCTGIQHCNIGDIAHVTGILNLLNIYLPETKIILWPRINVQEFDDLILKYYPDVSIIKATLENQGEAVLPGTSDNQALIEAAKKADFALAGKGEEEKLYWFSSHYQKPYGLYGGAIKSPPANSFKPLLDNASFIFVRETDSLKNLKKAQVACKVMDFAPDASFGCTIQDDWKAVKFIQQHRLEYKKFICVIPRLRVTPYYRIAPSLRYDPTPWSEEKIKKVDELNAKHKEKDHAKVREAMIAWVRRTGYPVLLCPEMIHNMELYDELLVDPLPDDVKEKVIKRDYFWLTDEAAAVYKNATAVLSFECHSPILACVQGTPAFYLRQPEDTIKGQMWYDMGLTDWVFEIEQTEGQDIANRLMEVYNDYPKARDYLESAMDLVRKKQRDSLTEVRKAVGITV